MLKHNRIIVLWYLVNHLSAILHKLNEKVKHKIYNFVKKCILFLNDSVFVQENLCLFGKYSIKKQGCCLKSTTEQLFCCTLKQSKRAA